MKFGSLALAISVFTSLGTGAASAQQAWPSKPVHWIVPYAAGGFADIRARKLGVELALALGQPVVIENRAGAGGVLGTDIVAKAAPDGYTMGMGNLAPLAVNVSLMKKLPYDPQKDLSPVILIETSPLILTAGPGLPAKNVQEVIALAKARPGQLAFASSGVGGAHHLSGEMLRQASGIDIVHIAYKGGGTPEAFGTLIRSETGKWAKVVKQAGIRPE
jgi:tripartite-type tricarboxylate transporter receptor subunit TctC